MAMYKPSKDPDPIKINKWLGVNEAVGQTGLALGESLRQVNFRITKDYKPQKRPGHNTFVDFGNELDVQGMWSGTIGGTEMLIACNNGHVYRDKSISGTVYDSLDTATYANVDVVKTTALTTAEAGSVNVDGVVILYNSARVKMTEVAFADLDLEASVGKFYFDADEKINYIVTKGTYANIAAARTGLGTTTAYYRIGALADAKTSIIYFQSKLLFWNGTDLKEYDGTTYQDIVPYVPTVYIATPPAGSGTASEVINLLTGRKKQEFQGDGVATAYQLVELAIDVALVTCTVDGAAKVEITDFTVNRTTGVVTFTIAPANGALVILEWTKVVSGHADLVKKNKYCMTFGPGNDTSIFIWGNPDQKNRRSWCASLNANYWPVTYFTNVGTNEYAITDIKAQNANYQIIFKEDRAHYSYAEYISATQTYDYPVYDLNEKVGNIAYNGVQIVNNDPVSIDGSAWWLWSATNVEDERNTNVISQRLEESLNAIDLTTAVTFDYQDKKEYWCNVGEMVYIWNYGNDTMYTYDNISGTCFLNVDSDIYYGSQGTIEKMFYTSDFDSFVFDDNGEEVIAQMDTGFNAFGAINLLKGSDMINIGLLPDSRTSITIYYKTNKISEWKQVKKIASYVLINFDDIDFDDFSFETNGNPQPFPLPFNSGDYVYIQFRFENAEIDETCVLLDFLVNAEVQGEI
jgi:hypothetical protein